MKRDRIASFRLTVDEHQRLKARADKRGMNLGDLLREVALQPDVTKPASVPPPPAPATRTFSAAHRAFVLWGNGQYGTTCTVAC